MGYDSKGILVFNLKYEHAISFINLVKFINYYQMPRSISSKLFVIASGAANVYGLSYYRNFRTSSFKQVVSYYNETKFNWYICIFNTKGFKKRKPSLTGIHAFSTQSQRGLKKDKN